MESSLSITDLDSPNKGELVQINPKIYWLRMPLPMKLNHINLYMIDEGDSWTLIDTGMGLPDTKAIWQSIFKRYCKNKPISRLLVTHMHPDHVGLAGWLVEQSCCDFFMTQSEYLACCAYTTAGISKSASIAFYKSCGMPEDYLTYIDTSTFQLSDIISPMPHSYNRLQHGDEIILGGYAFKVITGEGHTFEHACFYSKTLNILIAGDQLLPGITPNVSVNAISPNACPLKGWYRSLDALKTLPQDTWVLPAHNKPFVGVHVRIDEIKAHHEMQLDLLCKACNTPKTIYELLPVLFRREIGFAEMPLAVGECYAHINMLIDRKLIICSIKDNVKHYCKTGSSTL